MAIDDESIDIRRYIWILVSYWWLMLLLGAAGGVFQYLRNSDQEVVYEANATLLVQHRNPGGAPGVSDVGVSKQLATTYARLLTASPFLSKVRENNNDIQSLGSISASVGSGPPTLNISVRNKNAQVAAATTDIVAREFIDYVIEQRLAEIARVQVAAAAQGIANVQDLVAAQFMVLDSLILLEPVSSAHPIVPKIREQVLLGIFLGVVLAGGGALLLGSLRDTVRNPDELLGRFGVMSLGSIFRWSPQHVDEDELVVWKLPSSGFSESFRQIRANIQFATANQPGKVYLVTSPGPGDGKSTIIGNLAVAFAHSGKKVVLIDGDLRRPGIHRRFPDLNREPGLSNFLSEREIDFADVVHTTPVEGVSVIPGGPIPPNPSELLGSPRMSALLENLKEVADIILVDSPPILMVADGPILAAQVDGAVVVVQGFGTRSASLRAALDTLRNTQVNIVGVIINKLKRARFGYGYPYYYYYDKSYYKYPESQKASVNGTGPIYKRPVEWFRSVLSKIGVPSRGS